MRKLADKTIEFTLPTIDAEVPSFQVGSSSVPSALGWIMIAVPNYSYVSLPTLIGQRTIVSVPVF